MNQHITFIGKASGISVSISHGNCGNPHLLRRDISSSIADRHPRPHILDVYYMAFQLHSRFDLNSICIDLIGGHQPIQNDSSTYQIQICLRKIHDSRAVGTVAVLQGNPSLLQIFCKRLVAFQLLPCRLGIVLVGPGKMGKHSLHYHMRHSSNLCNFLHRFLRHLKSKTAEACINFHMNCNLCPCLCRGFLHFLCLTQRKYSSPYALCHKCAILFWKNCTQYQNWFLQSISAQNLRFLYGSSCISPSHSKRFQFSSNRHCTMTITIRFNHTHDFCFFADTALHLRHIVKNSIQINLCIDPTVCFHVDYLPYISLSTCGIPDKISCAISP